MSFTQSIYDKNLDGIGDSEPGILTPTSSPAIYETAKILHISIEAIRVLDAQVPVV